MATDISIAISAKDNFTDTITKIRNAQTPFRKDLTELNKELTKLNNTKVNLKVDLTKAKSELRDAEKAFRDVSSEANKMNLAAKQANYNNLKSSLDAVSKSARQAQKDIESVTGATIRSENRASSGRKGGIAESGTAFMSQLGKAGAFQMLGQTASNAAVTFIGSAGGEDAGIMAGSVLSGAGSGAAIGSMFGPAGTAIGAAVGSIVGAIDGQMQIFKKEDDAFKSVIQDKYQQYTENYATLAESGIGIAGNREQRQISFTTMLGGDSALAESYLKDMTQFAAETPFEYDQLADLSKTLLAYNYNVEELLPLLTKIGDTGSALGLGADDMKWVAASLGKMNTTGKTTLEYLNPLLERGIPVFDYLAEASGKTKEEITEMVSKGLIPGEEAAAAIADYMGQDFAGNMEIQAHSYEGLQSTLADQQAQRQNAYGEAYNNAMKPWLEEQVQRNEENQEAWDHYYKQLAERDAQRQIEREKSIFNAQESAIKEMYNYRWTDADKMEQKLVGVSNAAESAFMNTLNYTNYEAQQDALISSIQSSWKEDDAWRSCGYDIGLKLTEGMASVPTPTFEIAAVMKTVNSSYTPSRDVTIDDKYPAGAPNLHAFGENRVPYDNYLALLHEGERVLTASEARAMDRGTSPAVTVTGNTFNVREEADINKIASEIARKVKLAQMIM